MFDETRRATLRAVCDTVVPSIERDPDPTGLWARSASDLGVPEALEQLISEMPPADRDGLGELLDALGTMAFTPERTQDSREQILRNLALLGGTPAAAGVGGLISLTLFLAYGAPDPATGRNPMWDTFGYPGPQSAPPQVPKTITLTVPDGPEFALEADVVVVGSGAGGGVIAGELAKKGAQVVVLEAGAYRNESDFLGYELEAYQQNYWRGGPQTSADLNITVMAGAGLGGGTVINWTNSLKTRPWVREEWAQAGLEDVGTDFDRHVDAVWDRLTVNDRCSDLNGVQRRIKAAVESLGWNATTAYRNVDPEKYDPSTGGLIGFGDASGAKQSTLTTYLQDAFDRGAKVLCRTTVERVLVEGGRAAGVVGTYSDPATGVEAQVTVRAPRVVLAAGALETPAILLRSGIGGPAAGRYLRLHPTIATAGLHSEDLEAWWGAPHALLVDEFEDGSDAEGFGFRLEGSQYAPGLIGSATPWASAEAHKAQMERFRYTASWLGRIRDHGHGQVVLDDAGQSQILYDVTQDPIDVATIHRAMDALARVHEASGAVEQQVLAQGTPVWRRGDDLQAYIGRCQRLPLRFGGVRLFTAHEMGSARMGADPSTSVANPLGALHDTPGVWIGDASAFPTASGTNPMISIMALAHRTAEHLATDLGAPTTPALQEA